MDVRELLPSLTEGRASRFVTGVALLGVLLTALQCRSKDTVPLDFQVELERECPGQLSTPPGISVDAMVEAAELTTSMCRAYSLTIKADGSVEVQGKKYVDPKPGPWKLPPERLRELTQKIDASGFARTTKREVDLGCKTVLEGAGKISIAVFADGRGQRLELPNACQRMPILAALYDLARQIDTIANVESVPCSVEGACVADAKDGELMYSRFGCEACHKKETTELASNLVGLYGSKVELTDGRTVEASPAYLAEAILQPGKSVVKGYGPTMPAYQGQIRDVQLVALVAYLKVR